jgi:S-adenosylmethionine:tRNA ribosyltransferase-isomerase
MKTQDFSFDLPKHAIAQFPSGKRGESRLMLLDRKNGKCSHRRVADLPNIISAGSVLVFNNSKVRKARLSAFSEESGASVEFLLLKQTDSFTWETLVQKSKRRRAGSRYTFADGISGEIISAESAEEEFKTIRFDKAIDEAWLEKNGHIPLPPYIKRKDEDSDSERYQTIYAKAIGSAAAPTAGLHFTEEILSALKDNGIEIVFITLHVGLGTFLPVRTETIEDHVMHEESFTIDEDAAQKIERAKSEGRKVIAVGTTSVRTLESAWRDGRLERGERSTSIFIYPGYKFKVVDELFTNFHTPQSTLLMLVSAFADRDMILASYQEALQEGYRFFSYGDAMLII